MLASKICTTFFPLFFHIGSIALRPYCCVILNIIILLRLLFLILLSYYYWFRVKLYSYIFFPAILNVIFLCRLHTVCSYVFHRDKLFICFLSSNYQETWNLKLYRLVENGSDSTVPYVYSIFFVGDTVLVSWTYMASSSISKKK